MTKPSRSTVSITRDMLPGKSPSDQVSVPIYVPVSVGGEAIFSPSDQFNIVGGTVSVGVGTGFDIHATASITETKAQFNIGDFFQIVWSTITGWFGG